MGIDLSRYVKNGVRIVAIGALALTVVSSGNSASTNASDGSRLIDQTLSKPNKVSQSVVIRYWLAHPESAPAQFRKSIAQERQAQVTGSMAPFSVSRTSYPVYQHAGGGVFNEDGRGLPQNEESVTVCSSKRSVILSGTNDYRGIILDPFGNSTGWDFTNDGGENVVSEGLLPTISGTPSGGDPVFASDSNCNLYAGDINFDPQTLDGTGGIGVYRTTPGRLAVCHDPGNNQQCWPTRRLVARAQPNHFLDKDWIAVGRSGSAGNVVWATYTDFYDPTNQLQQPTSVIRAVRCNSTLSSCTNPIPISTDDTQTQFSYVTIGPDGGTYVTWAAFSIDTQGNVVTNIKYRRAPAGSTKFGPVHKVVGDIRTMNNAPKLHSNDFRVASIPVNTVRYINGHIRTYVVWGGCGAVPYQYVCEEANIKLRYSDNDGRTWSTTKFLSNGGDNYFPTISSDRTGHSVAVAYYTNKYDRTFHAKQDVELVSLNPTTLSITKRQRVTTQSNDPEADPTLGGAFIGDYFQILASSNTAYITYNASYRPEKFLGQGVRISQQDNYLAKRGI